MSATATPRLSGPRLWLAPLLNQRLAAELQLEEVGGPSLDEAKRQVTAWLDRAPDFWEASDDQGTWRDRVKAATTSRALIDLFS